MIKDFLKKDCEYIERMFKCLKRDEEKNLEEIFYILWRDTCYVLYEFSALSEVSFSMFPLNALLLKCEEPCEDGMLQPHQEMLIHFDERLSPEQRQEYSQIDVRDALAIIDQLVKRARKAVKIEKVHMLTDAFSREYYMFIPQFSEK